MFDSRPNLNVLASPITAPAAAGVLGQPHAKVTELPEPAKQLARDFARRLPGEHVGRDLARHERAQGLTEDLVFLGESRHGCRPLTPACRRRPYCAASFYELCWFVKCYSMTPPGARTPRGVLRRYRKRLVP